MMSDKPKKRKQRDTSRKRQVILDGAIAVFTEYGYDAASMDKIAEAAGVSKRTVYNHFLSKESLFQTVVGNFIEQHDEKKPVGYSTTISLPRQLKEFARAELYLVNDPERRRISKLLTSTFLMNVDFGNETRNQYESHKALIRWLNAAKADEKMRFESPELAATVFYGMIEGCLTWDALLTDGESLKNAEPVLDEIVCVFLSRYGVEWEGSAS